MSRFESSPVVSAFTENIKNVVDPKTAHFVCGVSGGIDSMTLLYLLHRFETNCTVVHCNYQLRGEASDKDRDLVEQISAMWNFECITASFDPEEAEIKNTQAWARVKRYRVFRDIKKQVKADYILIAHHQTDQVETILQKILRGSGLPSWKGMGRVEGDLLRPLINVTRQQISEFSRAHEVPYRVDETNESAGYARNFLRHVLTPDMDHFFPGWHENILKLPERAEEFSLMTDVLLSKVQTGKNRIDRKKLLDLPQQLWPVLFLRFLKKVLPDSVLSEGLMKRFLAIDELQTGNNIEIDEEWRIVRNREYFELVIGEIKEEEKEISFTRENLSDEQLIAGCRLSLTEWNGRLKEDWLQMDADKLTWPVTVRRWKEGDRIQCLGMKGSKKIADLLTDKKINSPQKRDAFLIESFDGIISAVIFPHTTANGQRGIISEQVKCNSATNQILQIETDLQ
ncbi:tRNA lysidine(34) synthetase TilS [soil metagenome]